MKSIWVVEGCCGEYDDRREWPVCGYLTETKAKKHAALAQARANELFAQYDHGTMPEGANQFDPHMSVYDSDAEYRAWRLEIRVGVPK